MLGFSDLVRQSPERVGQLYRIVDSLNVHVHNGFRTIVFSDTILVYNNFDPQSDEDHKYAVMFSCEFAQDLLYRLIGHDLYFRAFLTCGDFNHYELKNIECFYGSALITAYQSEKRIPALGLFIDHACNKYNKIFPTASFTSDTSFVYVNQCLERLQFYTDGKLPVAPIFLEAIDDLWQIPWDIRFLSDIYGTMRNHPDPRVRTKHLATWDLYRSRYSNILTTLEGANFDPKVVCPSFDWSETMARFHKDVEYFR
jgi:hypothetical protein